MNDSQPDFAHLKSPGLDRAGFRHAFFTRVGGASEGPFSSLSFSTAVGDSPQSVAENLCRAALALGLDAHAERVLYLSQVHGMQAHFFSGIERRTESLALQGDALGGSELSTAYGVRTADCVPILVGDAASGAVMAIHAGWRGIVAGVVESGIGCLRTSTGGAGKLLAAVGPHISQQAFEVSEDVAAALEAVCPTAGAVDRSSTKPHVDLRLIVTHKLLALGLASEAIDQVEGCTFQEPARFFSFRRDGRVSGRHLSAIVPRS